MPGSRARPRSRATQAPSRSGVACMVLLFTFVAFEFWVMHHHGPTHQERHGGDIPRFPGAFPVEDKVEHNSAALPGEPLLPDSMEGGAVAGTEPPVQHQETWAATPAPAPETEDEDVARFTLPERPVRGEEEDGEGEGEGQSGESSESGGSSKEDNGYGDMRVAVLVPYSGPGLPLWFDAFTDLAAANKNLVDWIIFCEEDLAQVRTPPNVKMISMSPSELAWMLAGVVYPANADEYPEKYVSDFRESWSGHLTELQTKARTARFTAARFIQTLLSKNPYYMVEFKPALGWVFREYLKDYTHWAYGDLDVFFGDLTKGWLEASEMREYDVVTYSFGDQHRAYLRGQLTVHKSIPKVNQIWRNCQHLSNYLKRIERTMETKRYNLESAEGCYSMALMYSRDIKAKYAVKVFTDMPGGKKGDQEEVVITGDALIKRCPQQDQRRGDVVEPDYGGIMQVDTGEYFPVEMEENDYRCEYWISPSFQTCLKLKESKHKTNVFLLDGQYFEREFVNLWRDKVEDGCGMGAFHHFQEFKGSYRAWNTRPPMPPIHRGMLAADGGLVPLPNGDWRVMALDPNAPPPAGRDRFTHRYCLQWSVTGVTQMEAKFSCDISLTPRDGLRTLHDSRRGAAREGSLSGGASVTLGGIGGFSDAPRLLRGCRDWEGPKILVLMLRESQREAVATAIQFEVQNERLDNALIMFFFVPKMGGEDEEVNGGDLPSKALLNAVGDLCQTRHLVTLPPGFRVARGAEKAVVAALETPTETPRVLVIPQWCVNPLGPHGDGAEESSSLDLEDLERRAEEGTARLCMSHRTIPSSAYVGVEAVEGAVKEALGGRGGSVGLRGGHDPRKITHGTPLLRSDAMGPAIVVDMWSAPALFLRHIEETSRSGCFDGAYARGLWAAGFSFEVLPEAAVFSNRVPSSGEECRAGMPAQMSAYGTFLQDVRRVYSGDTMHHDVFKSGMGGNDEARNLSRRKRTGIRPFGRSGSNDNTSKGSNAPGGRVPDSEPDLENA